jgi:ribose 5-phosphate isomerase RpiB
VAEEDYAKAQEELAELFSQGRGDMGIILSGRGVEMLVNRNAGYKPLLKLQSTD